MMSPLASATLALGFSASAALAGGYTDADVTTTETQEVGSTTSDGAIWYSMNVCEIVQHTQCDVSLSQGGAAPPPEETGGEGNYPPPPGGETTKPSGPATGEPEYSPPPAGGEVPPTESAGGDEPAPTEGSSGDEPAPTEGGDEPPPSEGPAPTEGGDEPAPTVMTTTDVIPATTNSDGSVVPSGSATEETSNPSTTAGALALLPAAIPAVVYGALALLVVGV